MDANTWIDGGSVQVSLTGHEDGRRSKQLPTWEMLAREGGNEKAPDLSRAFSVDLILRSVDAQLLLQVLQVATELLVRLLQVVHRAAGVEYGSVVLSAAVRADVGQ